MGAAPVCAEGWNLIVMEAAHRLLVTISVTACFAMASCSTRAPNQANAKTRPSTGHKNGTITADPNPIDVCDGSGYGVSKLSWTSVGPGAVEVHVNSPKGDLLAGIGPSGIATTGKWVTDGMIF